MTSDITKKVLEKIKEERVEPVSRWRFRFFDFSAWGLSAVSMAAGAIVVAIIFYLLVSGDWDAMGYLKMGRPYFLYLITPVWLVLLTAAALALAFFSQRHTVTGYRRHYLVSAAVVLAVALCLGALLYMAGWGKSAHQSLENFSPVYGRMCNCRHHLWSQPEMGALGGTILEVNNSEIGLKDFESNVWKIDVSSAVFEQGFYPQIGQTVRIAGDKVLEGVFKAKVIWPFTPGQGKCQGGYGSCPHCSGMKEK